MTRKPVILLALVVVVLLVVAAPVGAKKPASTLEGEMDPLELVVPPEGSPPPLCSAVGVKEVAPDLCACVEGTEFRGLYAWEGTIAFPEGDYTIVFINLATARENPSGVASPFDEIWAIYHGPVIVEEDGCPSTDHIVGCWNDCAGRICFLRPGNARVRPGGMRSRLTDRPRTDDSGQ